MKKLTLCAIVALSACVDEVAVDGRQAFLSNCAACHGTNAMGDGPMAAQLDKAPPDLTTLTQRYGGTYPRDKVLSTIDGLNRAPHASGGMPEFGAGDMGPIVMTEANGNPLPIPAQLLALSDYLETIQR